MSSNHNHTNNTIITRANYEEAFLLYVDDELTPEEKAAVEAFVLLHPDLGEELELLLSTKLPLTDVNLEDKAPLFANSMKLNTIDENLLLYIDDELPPAEQQKVAAQLKEDKLYSQQHQLLLQTKLDAAEKIVYPYKDTLYRKEERRIGAGWWRVAAAAVIVLWASTFDWSSDRAATSAPVALQAAKPAPGTTVQSKQSITSTPAPTTNKNLQEENTLIATTGEISNKQKENVAHNSTEDKMMPAATHVPDAVAAITAPVATPVETVTLPKEAVAAPQQIINNAVVTSDVTPAYITTEAQHTTTVPVDEVATSNNERGGSLKGFLRKTTRFIERTTNINPVNADDELLIGAISIKLK